MLAPNETYDSIAGTKPGEACAIRDGPYATPEIGKKFGFTEPREHNMNMPFVEKWTSVLREYSVRCGEETDFVKIPKSQFVGKAQSHILAPLGVSPDGNPGNSWLKHGVKRDAEQVETLRKVSEILEK